LLYLGVSETHEAQLNILKALTRKFSLDPKLELAEIAERCPFNYTGADFYALCSDALLSAMTRKAEELDQKIGMELLTYARALANVSKQNDSTSSLARIVIHIL
jgi:peroxin-6